MNAHTYIEKTAKRKKKQKTAVIIKGNPKYIQRSSDKKLANSFYRRTAKVLERKGYDVSYDAGLPYTQPKAADIWIGHSRGADRLQFAPNSTKTLAFGSRPNKSDKFKTVNHWKDERKMKTYGKGNLTTKDLTPGPEHYVLTRAMRKELEKIAARKNKPRTRAEIVAAYDRIQPNTWLGSGLYEDDSLDELKRGYRSALKEEMEQSRDVPFEERARNYKHFKKTGRLPPLDYDDAGYFVDENARRREAPWSKSKQPVTIYHGGGEGNLKRAIKNPGNTNHSTYLIPGETKATRAGLFFAPERKNAESYASMRRTFGADTSVRGKPALLSTTVPKRKVLGTIEGTEAFVGAKNLRKARNVITRLLK